MRSCHHSSVIAVLYAIGDRERRYNNKHHPGNYGNPRMAPQVFRVTFDSRVRILFQET
jgi:hypothetical protein